MNAIKICSAFFLICQGSFGTFMGGRVDVYVLVDIMRHAAATPANTGGIIAAAAFDTAASRPELASTREPPRKSPTRNAHQCGGVAE